jgi:archaellum component FlaC
MMLEELYDALIEAGASEEKARAASRAIADMEGHFANIEGSITRLAHTVEESISRLDHKVEQSISKLDQKIDQSVARLEQNISRLEHKMEQNVSLLDQKIDQLRSYTDQRFTAVDGTLRLHNWMMGTMLAFIIAMFFKMFSH